MREAGITKGRVVCLFLYSMLILLLVLVFIFVGVTAFVGEGAFGAVINSLLTAGLSMLLDSQTATFFHLGIKEYFGAQHRNKLRF